MKKKYLIAIFSLYYLAIILTCFISEKSISYKFKLPNELPEINPNKIVISEIATLSKLTYNHASAITELNNKLFVIWYSATAETDPDTKIMLSIGAKSNDGWNMSKPKTIMDLNKYQELTKKGIHHVGNPTIFANGSRLWVIFTSSSSGWATSSLNAIYSDNEGKTWSKPKIIISSPVFDYSTLTRGAIIPLSNDMFALPAYKEFNNLNGRWLVFNKEGDLVFIDEMSNDGVTLQPTVVPISQTQAMAYYREMNTDTKKTFFNKTSDSGKTWSEAQPSELDNPGSGIAAIKTQDGILMVYNDALDNRLNLSLAYKKDNSINWHNIYTFDNPNKYQLSYPFFTSDGKNIFLTFSYGPRDAMSIRIVEIKGENTNA